MPHDEKKPWQSLAALRGDPAELARAEREFAEELPVGPGAIASGHAHGALVQLRSGGDVSRRGFFGLMGLSAAAVGIAACQRAPVAKVVPYLSEPDGIVPGVSNWYASACAGCDAQCGVLLKSRDGRPIKVEGNPEHPLSQGGVCAVGQASIVSLYDASRARAPLERGQPIGWDALDAKVLAGLEDARSKGKAIRVVAPLRTGPTFESTLAQFLAAWPGARVARFEPSGELTALADAHQAAFGARAVPSIHLDRARTLASFACDFLGSWVAPVAFARQYAKGRALPLIEREGGKLGQAEGAPPDFARRHWQLEPALSLTGASADRRHPLAPSELVPALGGLVRRLALRSMHPDRAAIANALPRASEPRELAAPLDALAAELSASGAQALVLCGASDLTAQALCVAANQLLGAYGTTIDIASGASLPAADLPLAQLFTELEAGQVGAVIFLGTNPVYAHPDGEKLAELLARAPLSISTADRLDETARDVALLAPDHAPAESWGDSEARRGLTTLRQPALMPLFETRAAVESLSAWSAGKKHTQHELLCARAEAELYPRALHKEPRFDLFWTRALHDGFVETEETPLPASFSVAQLGSLFALPLATPSDTELWLHSSVALRDGRWSNNAWLQELPDPLTKTVWDNAACIAPARATALGLDDGDLITVTANGRSITLPVLVQPGTHPATLAIAIGYGRTAAGNIGNGVGVNAFPLLSGRGPARNFIEARLVKSGGQKPLARSQTQASLEGRPHIRTATLAAWSADPGASNPEEEKLDSLWSGHEYPGHRWGMAIDLGSCTGCSACVISCQAENNIPAVGRDEVSRGREMHWLRLDRYFAGEPDSPEVLHQPMLCQHCTNAPCETVCPVLATVHSSEGLNQQVYNRCVGTRYCANNCPPKVRRFNWFEYRHDDPVERLALNPDVVVRSRGVMEKCSMCVQRIQEGKALARRDGRPLADGEIQTACQQSCPSQAITFGDLNDPNSRVAKLTRDARAYRLLHELNIGPVISYLTRIKNTGA